jgi:hypothetical protein
VYKRAERFQKAVDDDLFAKHVRGALKHLERLCELPYLPECLTTARDALRIMAIPTRPRRGRGESYRGWKQEAWRSSRRLNS